MNKKNGNAVFFIILGLCIACKGIAFESSSFPIIFLPDEECISDGILIHESKEAITSIKNESNLPIRLLETDQEIIPGEEYSLDNPLKTLSLEVLSTEGQIVFYPKMAAYPCPSHICQEAWKKVLPYLLPENHPAKSALDSIFLNAHSSIIYDKESLKDAGFNCTPKQGLRAVVVTHPKLPKYVIKTYLDSISHSRKDWQSWINRIQGSEKIRKWIKKAGHKTLFKVPRKWIYLLPNNYSLPEGAERNNFILVVENMDLIPHIQNKEKWLQLNDKRVLDDLAAIVTELGLRDCTRPCNIPWCKDGSIAFVDTESNGRYPVHYSELNKRLNPQMLKYWKKLTQ